MVVDINCGFPLSISLGAAKVVVVVVDVATKAKIWLMIPDFGEAVVLALRGSSPSWLGPRPLWSECTNASICDMTLLVDAAAAVGAAANATAAVVPRVVRGTVVVVGATVVVVTVLAVDVMDVAVVVAVVLVAVAVVVVVTVEVEVAVLVVVLVAVAEVAEVVVVVTGGVVAVAVVVVVTVVVVAVVTVVTVKVVAVVAEVVAVVVEVAVRVVVVVVVLLVVVVVVVAVAVVVVSVTVAVVVVVVVEVGRKVQARKMLPPPWPAAFAATVRPVVVGGRGVIAAATGESSALPSPPPSRSATCGPLHPEDGSDGPAAPSSRKPGLCMLGTA